MKKSLHIFIATTYAGLITVLFAYTIIKVHGFSYDATNGSMVRMGVIDIESNVEGGSIFLNGDKYSHTTPTILWTHPGIYELEIVKNGYLTWKESIEVTKEQAVQKKVILLPNIEISSPKLLSRNIELITLDTTNTQAAFVNNQDRSITIYNLSSNKVMDTIETNGTISRIAWYNKEILAFQYNNKKEIYTYDLWNGNLTSTKLTVNNFRRYFGNDTRTRITESFPYLRGQDINQHLLSNNEDKIWYTDDISLNVCDNTTKSCETLTRISEPIDQTIFINSTGALLKHGNTIDFCSLDGNCQQLTSVDPKSEISYNPRSKELFFTQKDGLYTWKIL